jgi:predicted nucleic acid-binding protein
VPEKWVVNASPVISLARLDKASLLVELCEELLIPSAVAAEISRGSANDPAKLWLQEHGQTFVRAVGSIDPIVSAWDLGRGETEVINWAFTNPGWIAVVDDRAARNCAESLGVHVCGTIGIIIVAKKRRKIEAVGPTLRQLDQVGFRISSSLIDVVLDLAGES